MHLEDTESASGERITWGVAKGNDKLHPKLIIVLVLLFRQFLKFLLNGFTKRAFIFQAFAIMLWQP